MKIKFIDEEHKNFYLENCFINNKLRCNDCYYKSLFYLLGLSSITRNNFTSLFNLEKGAVIPDALNHGWQTSSSRAVTRLAFNLFTNSIITNSEEDNFYDFSSYSVSNIFASSYEYFDYFLEAIKIRFDR